MPPVKPGSRAAPKAGLNPHWQKENRDVCDAFGRQRRSCRDRAQCARRGGSRSACGPRCIAIEAGADGITAHLREDRRHIRDEDMRRLKASISKPLNFEMAATEQMLDIALKTRPHACCLVPEKRTERTTEGGLDVVGASRLAQALRRRTDPRRHPRFAVHRALERGAGDRQRRSRRRWSNCTPAPGATPSRRAAHGKADYEFGRLRVAAAQTRALGLECHAGHGLDYDTARIIPRAARDRRTQHRPFPDRRGDLRRPRRERSALMRAAMDEGRAQASEARK